MRILFLVIFSALFLSGCPGKATPPQTTREEPPKYLKFIFATTEVKKIPITVISRCQRYDLSRVKSEELFNYLKNITLKEKKDVEDNAIKLVEFLLTPESQEHFTNNTFEFPMIEGVSPSPLVVNNLGLDFQQDMKTKLASYGKNQAAALEVMTAAGWK